MADIINLKQVRKARAKADKEKAAEANRILHGTPKPLRNLAQARKKKADQALSDQKLEDGNEDNPRLGEGDQK